MKKWILFVCTLAALATAQDLVAEFHLQAGSTKQGKILSYTVDSVTVLGQFGGIEQVKTFPRSMFTSIVLADGSFLPAEPVAAPAAADAWTAAPMDSAAPMPMMGTDSAAPAAFSWTADTSKKEPIAVAPEPIPEPEPVIAPEVLPALPPIPGLRMTQKIAIGLWGASLASLGTGVVFNVFANQDIKDYDAAYDREDIRGMDTAESNQNDHIRGRNISYGISFGTLIAGAVLWFL